ncbi:rhomboid domain-containing protein 3 [Protobothrops mucrosquamatus]|uniref:rhomboid domain-containing protein 3 n=1 Tax=Protobothrops mucrosquamatus TaxID=103944 RepID=UPI000775AEA4|nr:rhomboid domain-containing protein 3 [Protobothrops mucrosquamatus]
MLIPRLRWVRHLPIASSILMLLLSVFWGTGIGDHFVLSPSLLSSPLQAFRLVTYCLGHANASLLAASLLFFPPLSWRLELHQGTLCYLRTTALSAAGSALVYLFLAGLWGVEAQTTISGYIPVHLALLGCHGRRSGWLPVALLAGLLFGLGEILSPRSPFLLHLSGLLTGLAYCAGTSSRRRLERLQGWIPGCSHLRRTFSHLIRPSTSGSLPFTVKKERIPAQEMFPPDVAGTVAVQILSPPPSWADERVAQESQLLFPPTSQHPFSDPREALGAPFFSLPDFLTEEELIQAGIRASLQDRNEEEVKLPKSSVSSLRLQQLQKMGFPTEEAVIALAATSHVEGAVSLLIGGHVGDKAVVMAENRSGPPTQPQSAPNP